MANSFTGDELASIKSSTMIYDAIYPAIKKNVARPSTWTELLKITREFLDKNDDKLNTNIIGRQVLINAKTENDIIDTLGLDKNDIRNAINGSLFFQKTFGRELKLMDQLVLGFPLILAALEYKRLGKKEESNLCYLLSFFKPYASRESVFFKYGVNEGQMLYTVENSLSGRFNITKYGTIMNCLTKMAGISYDNYIGPVGPNDKITDKTLYEAYTSGVASRVNNFIGVIVAKYKENAGKSVNFESPAAEVWDKDADDYDYEDADIQSDAAIKSNVVDKVVLRVTNDSVDMGLVTNACALAFKSTNPMYTDILRKIVLEVVDKMFDDIPVFFNCLIGSFLFQMNPKTGKRYTMEDFRSPIFLNVGIDTLAGKKSNLKDKNMLEARRLLNKMLEDYNSQYLKGETYNRSLRLALAAYWVFLIKST